MNESQPLRVFMISRDRLGLDPHSAPAQRWLHLVERGAQLEVCILAKETTGWEQTGIRVFGTGGTHFLARALRALKQSPSLVPDLVTAQDPAELGWIASRLAKRFHVKLEVQDHSGGFDGSGRIDESFNLIRRLLARQVLKKADAIRTVNPQSAAWLTEHTRAFSYWLPIVPRQEFKDVKRQTIPGRIACVARLVPVKRHRLLLEVFAALHHVQPDTTLVLIGDGPERLCLEELARELKLTPFVTFTGATDPLPFLAEADVFVLLSRHEGWGIAAVEAAMAGVPVVMTDTGCARFLEQRGNALIVRKLTISAIVEALQKQRSKQVKPLTDVLSPELAAAEQITQWKRLCQ